MCASVLPIKLPYHFARPPHVATYHMCRAKLSTRQVRLLFGELANTAEQIEAVLVDTTAIDEAALARKDEPFARAIAVARSSFELPVRAPT